MFLAAAVVCVTTVSEGGGLSIVSPSILNKKKLQNVRLYLHFYTFERKETRFHTRTDRFTVGKTCKIATFIQNSKPKRRQFEQRRSGRNRAERGKKEGAQTWTNDRLNKSERG